MSKIPPELQAPTPTIPEGFQQVSKEEFFAKIGPMDVALDAQRMVSVWSTKSPRQIVGYTWPGYLHSGYPWAVKTHAIRKGGA